MRTSHTRKLAYPGVKPVFKDCLKRGRAGREAKGAIYMSRQSWWIPCRACLTVSEHVPAGFVLCRHLENPSAFYVGHLALTAAAAADARCGAV